MQVRLIDRHDIPKRQGYIKCNELDEQAGRTPKVKEVNAKGWRILEYTDSPILLNQGKAQDTNHYTPNINFSMMKL